MKRADKRPVSQVSFEECLRRVAAASSARGLDVVRALRPLTPLVVAKVLAQGAVLHDERRVGEKVRPTDVALCFVETGCVSALRDPGQAFATLVPGSSSDSRNVHAALRVAAARARFTHSPKHFSPARPQSAFRLASYRAGAIIGLESAFLRFRAIGTFVADEPCVVHQLSFRALDALLADDPKTAAALLALCGAQIAAQHERSRQRLALLHDAFHSRPLSL